MPTAVIIGGRGQSGRAIGQRLVAGGWAVTATTSGPLPDPAATPGVRWSALARDQVSSLTGVVKPGTDLVTSRMLGCFRDNALTRQEFLKMVE